MELIFAAHIWIPSQHAHSYQIMQMCEAFADQGLEVTLAVAGLRAGGEGVENPWSWYGVDDNFKIENLCSPEIARHLSLVPHWIADKLGVLAWRLSLVLFALRLVALMRRTEAVILYTRDALPLWLIARILPRVARRSFLEIHGRPGSRIAKRMHRGLARFVGGMVAVTANLKLRLVELGIPAEKITVAPDGVKLERFSIGGDRSSWRMGLGWPQGAHIIGYAGHTQTLGQDKGVVELIKAIAVISARERDKQIYLTLIGPPPEEAVDLWSRHAEGIPVERLIAPGWVSHEQLPVCVKACDICVIPFPWTEFFAYDASPLKMFEYMASDVPIVASNLPALREILMDGKNAILIDPGDPTALADAIQQLIKAPDLGVCLGEQARLDVRDYTWTERALHIISWFEDATAFRFS